MKTLKEYINEMKGDPIDDQWINDKKPVITKDGRQAVITKVDYSQVPNVIEGTVVWKEKLLNYKWNDDGTCIQAQDFMGNPKKPDDADNLVKNS